MKSPRHGTGTKDGGPRRGFLVFQQAVNPVNGKIYVSNTEAANEKRFEGPGTFAGHSIRDRSHDAPLSDASLRQRALEQGGELTYTCTPPDSGVRIGIDRDEDGVLDGDK